MNYKQIISIITLIISTLALSLFVYKIYFKKHFDAQSFISEIETIKIDSTKESHYTSESYYEFWIGNYKIDQHITKYIPFKSGDRVEVMVRDIGGNVVMIYDTKYHYASDCWESDYIRLMKYLNTQHK